MNAIGNRYYVVQDTKGILDSLGQSHLVNFADEYFGKLVEILREGFAEVVAFYEDEVNGALRQALQQYTPDVAVVCLDRFLLRESSEQEIFRFSVNRTHRGLAPRVGNQAFSLQTERLNSQIGSRSILIVDDGVAKGGTINFSAQSLVNAGLELDSALVFGGNPNVNNVMGHPLRRLHDFVGVDWVNARDLSPFGGILHHFGGNRSYASPYFAPFSDGRQAALDGVEVFLEMSAKIIDLNLALIRRFSGEKLTFARLKNAGFPLPCPDDDNIKIPNFLKMEIGDFLLFSKRVLDSILRSRSGVSPLDQYCF